MENFACMHKDPFLMEKNRILVSFEEYFAFKRISKSKSMIFLSKCFIFATRDLPKNSDS